MARLDRRHKLEGFSGKVGKNLRLEHKGDGRILVKPHQDALVPERFPHWEAFKKAIAYARRMRHHELYEDSAQVKHSTPFRVATADFLHPPEIKEIDLADYHGRPGDVIRIFAEDDVQVTEIGVLITDEENHLLEMGRAKPGSDGYWVYAAAHPVRGHHVRVIVDAADLPGHLDEARVEKDV